MQTMTMEERHQAALKMRPLPNESLELGNFFCFVVIYRNATTVEKLEELARGCERRVAHWKLPIDIVTAYLNLAELARWRAAQFA